MALMASLQCVDGLFDAWAMTSASMALTYSEISLKHGLTH